MHVCVCVRERVRTYQYQKIKENTVVIRKKIKSIALVSINHNSQKDCIYAMGNKM